MPLGYSSVNVRSVWRLTYSRNDTDSKSHKEQPQCVSPSCGVSSTHWECDTPVRFVWEVAWPRFSIKG